MSKASLHCAAAIFNIRRTLQDYKNSSPPDTLFYNVTQHDLLEMLEMTMTAWNELEKIQIEIGSVISGLLDAAKKV